MPIVLVVEHEEVVRATVATILTRSGFEVLKAASLAEADRLCRERPEPIDLVIVNDAVVDASGPEVVKHVMRCHPEAKEMRFSGWPREYLLDQGTLAPQEPFVMKPFRTGEFLEQVRRVLGWLPNEQRARRGGGSRT
ncbi:MAG TPA: response regulator [Bryobacteraceae bacterium]|nr:response regulator [Bryobacteraceae bacterium]